MWGGLVQPLASIGALLDAVVASLGVQVFVEGIGSENQSSADEVAELIQANINSSDGALKPLTRAERSDLNALYRPRRYLPLWLDATGRPGRSGLDALTLLEGAADDGLDPGDYQPG